MLLKELVEKYGTDKNQSRYTLSYSKLFTPVKDKITSVLEIGIGSLDKSVTSNFAGNLQLYPHYKPGGSLRVWRDFFPNAKVYGVDIGKDCMFEEERIQTFLFDSSNSNYVDYYLDGLTFDIIIDDGNHDPKYQVSTLENLFSKLNPGGIYIIEDIGGYQGTEELLVEYLGRFNKVTDNCEVQNKGNHIIIKKPFTDTSLVDLKDLLKPEINVRNSNKNFTIVSGLWNLSREGRDFNEHYLPRFREFLKIDCNMILFLPEHLHKEVWKIRNKTNTFVKHFELEHISTLYQPHWEKTQKIRKSKDWLNSTGEGGWLKNSPQAKLEYYNPIVQSKMFMLHDASLYNVFDTEYFYWLDAGITSTVPSGHLIEDGCLDSITKVTDSFLFLSYPYQNPNEVHGFDTKALNNYAGEEVKYVCRGGLFGGHVAQISQANAFYYSLLHDTLSTGYMGTEESLFTIMAYKEPYTYKRYMLDDNGLIVKFTEALIKNNVKTEKTDKPKPQNVKSIPKSTKKLKTNLYILTFNFPEQLVHTLESMQKVPEWLEKPNLFLLDNSTDKQAKTKNKKIAKDNNFEYIDLLTNKGICGGRQAAAEHFHESDADFYFFFEDDMTSNNIKEEGNFCRNGFRKYIHNLYDLVHKIMLKESFDYLKLSFTEVYWDNDIQTSWYNVPQNVRTKFWPDYDRLPVTGRDPNAPRTKFDTIDNVDGLAYISGDVTYTNWPMIMSKEGNQKVFINTKWAHPYEQTWMSYVFQEQKKGNIKAGVLLASPIWHDRIKYYEPEERREN